MKPRYRAFRTPPWRAFPAPAGQNRPKRDKAPPDPDPPDNQPNPSVQSEP